MAHTYMLFNFADEEKAQHARHKLETWKQAFRLDKKLQYKLDRGEVLDSDGASAEPEPASKSAKGAKSPKSDKSAKSGAKSGAKADARKADSPASSGPVKLLVRLYFSGHEKKSEQRWLDRIPVEEPFKAASPKVVQEGEVGFEEALADFDRLG